MMTPARAPRALRAQRATLRPADERRLLAVEAGLEAAGNSADDVVAEVRRFTEDVESGGVIEGGIVLEPIEDNDSLVQHVEEGLQAVSRAQRGGRP